LTLVVKVGIFELVADLNSESKLVVSFSNFITLDKAKDFFTRNLAFALIDDGIADFSNQNNKSGWSVVVLRVSPNEQDGVHNWNE
jgi:isochorismate hydrolase